jgi:hypothetical protein
MRSLNKDWDNSVTATIHKLGTPNAINNWQRMNIVDYNNLERIHSQFEYDSEGHVFYAVYYLRK